MRPGVDRDRSRNFFKKLNEVNWVVLILLVATLESGRARLIPRAVATVDRFVEIEGTVDLIFECISDSSTVKDLFFLRDGASAAFCFSSRPPDGGAKARVREAYWKAGVREYWIADVRGKTVEFEVLVHQAQGYKPAPKDADGFATSAVLERGVRLTRRSRAAGMDFYGLDIQ